jgi:F-type H+-transporting ATPase subunit a
MIHRLFGAEDGPHIAIAPEALFQIGGIPITNSMVYGWICALGLIIGLIALQKKVTYKGSSGLARILDFGTEFVINLLTTSLNSRKKAVKYAPFFVTTFFFIWLNNWLGLLPGVGPAIQYNGTALLRPITADFNATISAALVMIIIVQTLAIRESSLLKHLRHYFQGNLKNPMTLALGGLELFSEFTRLISLALRLFLNVVIGEILISVFAYLGGTVAPLAALPFTLMEIFVGLLQAYIFVMLCASYLGVATAHNHEHEPGDENTAPDQFAEARV